MTEVFVAADNIISPLGNTTGENFAQLRNKVSAVRCHNNAAISSTPFYASLFEDDKWQTNSSGLTKFEQLLAASIENALQQCDVDPQNADALLIISSTKGNISLLETEVMSPALKERIALYTSAKIIANHFRFTNKPMIVSNACISGVLGIITGMRLIRTGKYKNVVVAGADVISCFILSGFQAFQATSPGRCKPFDIERDGINLGEGAGTIILSSEIKYAAGIRVAGGATSNDANHISGPSRTGAELAEAMKNALNEAGISPNDIDLISAHGTATIYNDEMEAKAISLAGMSHVRVNSLKGYFGHTLGAAGLIESIVTMQSMRESLAVPTIGFEQCGVSEPLNIHTDIQEAELKHTLKTASGFGGCNGVVLFSKTNKLST